MNNINSCKSSYNLVKNDIIVRLRSKLDAFQKLLISDSNK